MVFSEWGRYALYFNSSQMYCILVQDTSDVIEHFLPTSEKPVKCYSIYARITRLLKFTLYKYSYGFVLENQCVANVERIVERIQDRHRWFCYAFPWNGPLRYSMKEFWFCFKSVCLYGTFRFFLSRTFLPAFFLTWNSLTVSVNTDRQSQSCVYCVIHFY